MPASGALAMTTGRPASTAALSAATACASEWMMMTGPVSSAQASRPPAGCGPEATVGSSHRAEMRGDLDHAVREAPFVVVPGQDTHKGLVEHLGLGHVEGRAVRVVVEI